MAMIALKPASSSVARRLQTSQVAVAPRVARRSLQVRALLGPDGKPGTTSGKKFISREQEPEQYWSSKGEAEGGNPMKDPLAIIGVLAIFFPFIFLGIAVAAGYIDLSVYR
ncbi:hypothetical protein CHLRE_03g151200v5 [Chlamydomonas reinhardtii]|uniref:Uncharacterized protein n=1 Tax=Chlamydomonas reinhardtii TaxID=3055 RepID=A8J2N2_CHLRE|nr:uncharacterized protein CHLRE_03g151200v5 [Chlamydomonas reinhardtii]PNW84610.1 hypothetical protein CHLRE_03g151200v5 [Chlamydomonas reinhardtii]|eukprot:XP_001695550.1 predicted protein [Chlamydomonas reinhardtii]